MKLTQSLKHAKYFWWGKGWGQKPRKNTDHFYYKMQWKAKAKRPLEVIEQQLPENCQVINPNLYVKQQIDAEFHHDMNHDFKLPWPYSKRPLKGSVDDPDYKPQAALIYHRNKRLIEPINLPLNFSNSILENGLPAGVEQMKSQIKIDEDFLDHCRRRLQWSLENDCALQKLPLNREFPYLDQRPPRVYGPTVNRQESLILQTIYELINLWTQRTYGFNPNFVQMHISRPHCVYGPIQRDQSYTLMDLECDFITLLQSNSPTSKSMELFDSNYQENTVEKPLKSIAPITWKVGFDERNFYSNDFEFKLPPDARINTIYLSNNHVRMLNDEDYQGRSIMFCYGYSSMQQQTINNNNNLPQIIQCLFINPKSMNIGCVYFQLNRPESTDDNDNTSQIKNQVWLSEPRSLTDDIEPLFIDLLATHSFHIKQFI